MAFPPDIQRMASARDSTPVAARRPEAEAEFDVQAKRVRLNGLIGVSQARCKATEWLGISA
jgi:hypothetical protein